MKQVVLSLLVALVLIPNINQAASSPSDDGHLILLNAGTLDTDAAAVQTLRKTAASSSGKQLHLVQFAGPIQPEWYAEMEQAGMQVVTYIPNNAYLVYGSSAALAGVEKMAQDKSKMRWHGSYMDTDKIQPNAKAEISKMELGQAASDLFAVQLIYDLDANASTLALIDGLKLAPIRRQSHVLNYLNVIVRLPPEQLANIAGQPDVVSITKYVEPRKFDERQDQIVAGNLSGTVPSGVGYLAWLYSKGFTQDQFTASGFVVDVTDSGVDNGTNKPNHFGLYVSGNTSLASRVAYNRLEGTANAGSTLQGCDGHGNLNNHIIAGYNNLTNFPHADSSGYRYGLGVCPFVKVGSSVIFDPDNFTSPDYENLISRAYRDGARISSDSWGANTAGAYDTDAQAYDALVRDAQPSGAAVTNAGNQEMTIVFAAGNDGGSGAQTVGSPGTAKNVITVGATENVRSHNIAAGGVDAAGNDGCTTPDTEANSADDIASFSSRGPCSDSRHKPEICAPGTHITGGVAQQSAVTNGTGNDIACFAGTGVCGLPGGGTVGSAFNFFPTNQQFYSTSSGTSHSTPAVAGGCALIRQYFINQAWTTPSPAMVKAYLMNAARYMTGVDANDSLWSDDQGMGMMNLGFAFDGVPRVLHDQLTNETFTASGQSRVFTCTVVSNGKPVRVTLAWTDAPGATSGNAYKNNLNLAVSIGGRSYLGNVFNGQYSTNGGSADVRNNAESVFLPTGSTGVMVVTVSAANINSDGVPNWGTALDQDFALVIYNVTAGASNQPPVLASIGDKSVVTNNLLSFSVSAADPSDGDPVTLWATGIPPWATFGTVTNVAGVTNTFSGTAPATVGSYVTTFFARDKDGTNRETITIRVTAGGCVPTNIIDEGFAGGTTPPSGWTFTSIGGTYTTAGNYGRLSPSLKMDTTGDAIETPTLSSPTNLSFWIRGQGSPYTSTLLVESYIGGSWTTVASISPLPSTGTTESYAINDSATKVRFSFTKAIGNLSFDDVIIAGCSGGGGAPVNNPPVLNPIGDQAVVVSNTLEFAVTATPTEGDAVTLTASNKPAGTYFTSAGESGMFYWTNAAPVGVYTTRFYAADIGGVDFEQILITVQAAAGGGGGGTETFSNVTAPAATYGNGSYVGDGGIQWNYGYARSPDSTYNVDGQTIGFADSTKTPREVYSSTIPGGVGNLSVKYRKYFTGAGTRTFDVYVNTNLVGTVSDANNTNAQTFVTNGVNISGNVVIKISGTGGKQFIVDTLSWSSYSAPAGGDTDGDGIPDSWESQYFGGVTNATATVDQDQDGLNNLQEYIAVTDPTNKNSYFKIESIFTSPNSDALSFQAASGRLYGVDFNADLSPDAWSNFVSGLVGSNDLRTVTDTNDGINLRYYRLKVQKP